MAGLNIRLSKNGEYLYFQNKPKFLAQINLTEEPFNIDRVYNIKELSSLVKFEADVLGSEIVAMSSDGIIKVSEKNMTYHVATESKIIHLGNDCSNCYRKSEVFNLHQQSR